MRPVYILGVGAHPWGKFPNKPQLQLALDAMGAGDGADDLADAALHRRHHHISQVAPGATGLVGDQVDAQHLGHPGAVVGGGGGSYHAATSIRRRRVKVSASMSCSASSI